MKKTSESGKLITQSNRNIQRRSSNNTDLLLQTQEPELSNTDCFLPSPSDVNKKIQAKLRVRKAAGSLKRISKEESEKTLTSDKFVEEHHPYE